MIGLVAPVAEELFFRGFVFGTVASRFGGAVAFGLSVLLFAVVHLPQQWGAWGAFAAVLVLGASLSGLRWASGSATPGMLAHLTHNALLVVAALT
jgi:membrane protease YdiL (CAAX protease family)